MSELSRRLMATGGNVAALADQLEKPKAGSRASRWADDRRATRLRLSLDGRERFAEMATGHERWVIALFEVLSRDEQQQLLHLLGKLKPSLAAGLRRDANGHTTHR